MLRPGQVDSFPDFKRSPKNFRSQSSAACPNGIVHAIYNSQVLVDATGNIAAKYRKTHLYTVAPVEEQTCFAPGDTFASFALGGLHFGFSICYDLRFPEMYRKLVTEQNVEAFVISSAWPFPRVEHFRMLARHARSRIRVMLSHRTASVKTTTYGFVAAPRSSIHAGW